MALLLVLGLLVDWLCARLAALAEQQRLPSGSADAPPARWHAAVVTAIGQAGHLFLVAMGAIVILDILGLGLGFESSGLTIR